MAASDRSSGPQVSILMGVYNAAPYLDEAVASLTQQSFEDWELIAVDDGSSDKSRQVMAGWAQRDVRVRPFANGVNRGLAHSLNKAAVHARGQYFARQDADDRSTPDRFAKQVSVLNANPGIAFVSAGMIFFDEGGEWGEIRNVEWPTARDFVAKSPFAHAPSMIRRNAFEAVGGYRDLGHTMRVEDYDLWFRMYEQGFSGHNIQEYLYEVRDDRDAQARRKLRYRWNETLVKLEGYERLGLSRKHYPKALRPLLVGLVPPAVYASLRRRRYSLTDKM